jgi:membrane protease YdiL (CAAX protease family)
MVILAAAAPAAAASGDRTGLAVGAIAILLTLALTLLFIRWDGRTFDDFGFYLTSRSPLLFILGIGVGVILVGAHVALTGLFGPVHWVSSHHWDPLRAMLMLAVFLLLATREELAFRGYPLRKLASDLNPVAGQLIIAALFAIEHAIGGASWSNAVLGAGMGSLVFGMAALATRGLAMPIGLHAAYNFADWASGGKGEDGIWQIEVVPGLDQQAQIVSMSAYVAVVAAAAVAIWWWGRRTNRAS